MIKLLESINLFSCEVLIKTSTGINKVEVYHRIRAIKGVVVVTIRQSDFLDSKATDDYEWSLLYIKFISPAKPYEEIRRIGLKAIRGGENEKKIDGLLSFVPRYKSIRKVGGNYR
jgi:hypothetical protein